MAGPTLRQVNKIYLSCLSFPFICLRSYLTTGLQAVGIVLKSQGYTPRLIVVNMPGTVCDDVCYVNEAGGFIHYDWANSALQLVGSRPSIRQIANTLANTLNLPWTSASEITFSNGLCQIWATVVQTEPPSSDPVAGHPPASRR